MDNSAQNARPSTPTRRVVRRRLVQSTLFPLKPQQQLEEDGDLKAERGNGEDDDGEDEDFCGSQSKRKRKSKAKKTPPIKAPKKVNYVQFLVLVELYSDSYGTLFALLD